MADTDCTRTHTCAHCGTEFSGRKKRFCSADCQIKAKTGHDPAGHKCAHCGTRFEGRKKKYCTPACASEAKADRDKRRSENKRREAGAKPKQSDISGLQGTALYKRIMRFRSARRGGRKPHQVPLPRERPIWLAHQLRRANFSRYIKACRRIDSPLASTSPWKIMTEDQARMSVAREWKWRYNNDPDFRAKEKARLFLTKQRRRYQQEVTDDGTVTAEHIDQRRTCLYCGTDLTKRNRTLDHMIPLSKGGAHSASNVVECCRSCNSRKHAKDFSDWLGELQPIDRRRAEREWIKRRGAPPDQSPLFG